MAGISEGDIRASTDDYNHIIGGVTGERSSDGITPCNDLKCEVLAPDDRLYDLANPEERDEATRILGCVGPCAVRAACRTARIAPLY